MNVLRWKSHSRRVVPLLPSSIKESVYTYFLFLILLISPILSGSVQAADQHPERRELFAAVLADFPPLYILDENGTAAGFAVDMLNHIAVEGNFTVRYLLVQNWAEAMEALRQGRADVIPGIGISPDRKAEFLFTSVMETIPVSIFVRTKDSSIESLAGLTGHNVAVIEESVAETKLRSRQDITLTAFPNIDSALFQLLAGEVDAFVFPEPVLKRKARLVGIEDRIRVVGAPLMELKRGYMLRKSDGELVARLNPLIEKYTRSDHYLQNFNKWYGAPAPFWTVRKVVLAMSGLLVSIMLIMGYWRYHGVLGLNRQLNSSLLELSKKEADLKQSEKRFRGTFEQAAVGIAHVDREGRWLRVNSKFLDVLGYTDEDFGQKSFLDLLFPEEREWVRNLADDLLAGRIGSHASDVLLVDRAGNLVWTHLTVSAMFGETGTGDYLIIVVEDVRRRKEAELNLEEHRNHLEDLVEKRTEELRKLNIDLAKEITDREQVEKEIVRQNDFLITVINSLPHPFIVIDVSDYSIVLANDKVGLPDKWRGMRCHQLSHHSSEPCRDEEHPCPLSLVRQKGRPVVVEHVHHDAEGNPATVEVHGYPIFDEENRVVRMIEYAVDVTERKRLEEELIKSRNLEATGTLAGGIAHDFNNLLTVILGNLILAEEQVGPAGPIYQLLKEIEQASLRARSLTQQFVTFSRGGAPVRKVSSIKQLLEDAVSIAMNDTTVACELTVPENLYPVSIDFGQMLQAVANILRNAVEASPEKGRVTITAENVDSFSSREAESGDGWPERSVLISIRDFGSGIRPEDLPKIFDPYFSTKERGAQKGMGLGLSTAHSIIRKHKGVIKVESRPDMGTTAIVMLPAIKDDPSKKEA